ncbi:MAG: Tol-Pal system beta propeller repeat protein TolB, partial [Gammaproteobacteria bacterium]|nr:Tol-Pal system beta propeller repeat protein TolB [Gammaproteobacteria bacterium]
MSQTARIVVFALLLCSAWSAPVRAELTVVIREGVTNAIPVAVVPFGWTGADATPFDFAEVVANDLARSGRFAPMDRADMVSRPTSAAAVDFSDWRLLGAEIVVIGTLKPVAAGGYAVDFQLFDAVRGSQMLAYTLPTDRQGFRATAHRISDLVYEALTGERGAFSTRIAYVSVDDGRYELIVADADGANQQVVVRSTEPLMSPSWSPDSTQLAYVAFSEYGSSVYVQELASGNRREISARPGVNGAPAWSPDGRRLALALSDNWGNVDVHITTLDSGETQRLTNHPAIDTEPAWSESGNEVYFTSDRAGGPQVYRVAASGGTPQRVTFEGNY